jgi:hypothetical protein
VTGEDIKFNALRNAIYHSSRRRFFELLSRFLSFLVVISGTAAVAQLRILDPRLMAALAATIGALQLVFDFNGRARLHEKLQVKYYELIAVVDSVANPSEAEIFKWRASLWQTYADEPPPMRALDAIAYNAACDDLGFPSEAHLKVQPWHWAFCQIYSFPNAKFQKNAVKDESVPRSADASDGG